MSNAPTGPPQPPAAALCGLAALVMSKYPAMTPAQVEAALEHYDARAAIQVEKRRIELNEAMADLRGLLDVLGRTPSPDVDAVLC